VVHWQYKYFHVSTAISSPILPIERELSLAHSQSCIFLFMEQSCVPLAVEIVKGKHCDFRNNLAKRARAQSGVCARCSFLIMEQSCGPFSVEIVPRKHCYFSTYLAKTARAQAGACAEVLFPDYGIVLWSPVSRNYSRKALRFQHLTCQESESSVWRMRRGAFS
jgi:hypothetical protein